MKNVGLTITFTQGSGEIHTESQSIETGYDPEPGGEHRLAHILAAELKVMVGEQPVPLHNAKARAWLDFPNQPQTFDLYFDIQNSQAIWLELATLIMGAEADLALSQMFKALEPPQEPKFEDSTAVNDLYYLHDRKITLLNQALYALIKVQDLINRLLHESLGGDLVDVGKPDWERTQLTRKNVVRGLEAKCRNGGLSRADLDAIKEALAFPDSAPDNAIAVTYRNRLMHHVRPSVDYGMFYSGLQSRLGEEITDADGKIVGRRHAILARNPVHYSYRELHSAVSTSLDAIVEMLDRLSRIDVLRR